LLVSENFIVPMQAGVAFENLGAIPVDSLSQGLKKSVLRLPGVE